MNISEHKPWVALEVRRASAVMVTEHLRYRGYESLLPVRNGVPLFSGYVFCRFTASAGAPIVTTPGVIRIVSFGGIPAAIEEHEIAAIKRTLASGLPVKPVTMPPPGSAVMIVGGPLRGLRGTVLRVNDKRYLIVSVTLLQRSVAVEVDPDWIEL
jgi:transcription antitermination factor NusG